MVIYMPYCSGWCDVSEPMNDLVNALLNCKDWDPAELHSPLQSKIPAINVTTICIKNRFLVLNTGKVWC